MTHLWSIFQFLEVTLKSDFQRCCTLFKWNTIINIVTLIANAASVVLIQPRRSMFRGVQSSSFKSGCKVVKTLFDSTSMMMCDLSPAIFCSSCCKVENVFPVPSIIDDHPWSLLIKTLKSDISKFWCLCRDRPNPSDVAQPHVPTYIVVLVHVSFLVPPAMLLSISSFVPSWCVSSFSSSSSTQRLIFVCHR